MSIRGTRQVQESGFSNDHWSTFEEAFERAQTQLSEAKTKYRELINLIGTLPDEYATAINSLADDIEQLDDVLDVTEDDAKRAVDLADRVSLVTELLDAKFTFYTELVRVELSVYESWCDCLERPAITDLSASKEAISQLWSVIHRENYTGVWSGEPSLASIRADLYEQDCVARNNLSSEEFVSYCLNTTQTLTESLTNDLKRLVENDVQLSIKDERRAVMDILDDAQADLEDGLIDETTVRHARTGLEGMLMLTYKVEYIRTAHQYCQSLVELLEETESVDRNLSVAMRDRDISLLEDLAASVVTNEANVSPDERVVHLLRENDKSVTRVLNASDMNRVELFDGLQTAFDRGIITDIEVQFE